ncbi:MAG: winged helix-turn-helix domain-containing protein [Thermoplasmata archaeon]
MQKKVLTVDSLKNKIEVPKELLEKVRSDNQIKASILKALKDGPKTIPEIAQATGLSSPTVTWWLMTLRKYGSIIEEEGGMEDYYRYKLKGGK